MLKTKSKKFNPQIFTIWSDEIEGRIDPHFYHPEFLELNNNLRKFQQIKLGEISEFSNEIWNQKDFFEEQFPYIEISEIDINSGKIQNVKYINKNNAPNRAKMVVREDDIIISTTRPHRGAISLIDKNKNGFIASTGFAILRKIKSKQIQRKYLFNILRTNFLLNQMLQRSSGGNYPAITLEELKKIIIPVPSLLIQNKIVDIMEKAYKERNGNKTKARKLLDSINGYVLDELGIKIPEIKNKMCFIVYSDEVNGKRIDPKAYLEKPKAILKAIKKSKYKSKKLSNIIIESISGEWGEDQLFTKNTDDYILVNVLRNTNFDNKFNLNFKNVAERLITKDKFRKIQLKNGDILIEKSGGSPIQPVGRISLFDFDSDNKNYTFSNFLQCLRIDKNICLPRYLFSYLQSVYNLGYMEYVQNQTTGIKNLIMEEYLSIPVLIPSLIVQNKIVKKVNSIYSRARASEEQSKKILKDAKEKVEKIILN